MMQPAAILLSLLSLKSHIPSNPCPRDLVTVALHLAATSNGWAEIDSATNGGIERENKACPMISLSIRFAPKN